jgi:amino acid transporter/mannitol/fructose-specific phosphotransferase system IIA component (Ntr-type)
MALKRELGAVGVFAVAAGAMISSGLFVLPAIGYARVGPGIFLCYFLAALLLLPSVFSKAELMTAMPKAGGTYYFIDRSLGPGFGTVGGVAAWGELAFKSAFALLGIGVLAAYVWPEMGEWEIKAVACGFCVLFAVLNLVGVKQTGRVQIVLVVVLLCLLVGYVAGGIGAVSAARYRPLLPGGWNSLLIGTAMVFISFGGVTKVATLGEEVRRPKRDLLVGMFAACLVVGLLYVLAVFVTVGLLPEWRTLAPLSEAAGTLWGRPGAFLLGVAAFFAFATTGNAGILAASRTVMAMSQDDLLPPALSALSKRRGTPVAAVLLTSAFMLAAILLLDLQLFIKAASAMKLLLFMFTMLSVVLMRESRIPTYRPTWRCPLYPWLQIFGILAYGFLLVELGTTPLAVAGVVLGGALVWYAFYAKLHVLRESALVRLAARVAAADFEDHDLEAELSRVARERDRVLEDRFDRLIQDCTVLDLHAEVSRDELLRIVSLNLGPSVQRPPEELCDLLQRRETLSSTVIRPGLAIPHLIAEGLSPFQVLLIRSRAGVVFAEGEPPVHAVFVLAASPDERNFYLKALVAIAEIAQQADFDAKWNGAGSLEALREVVLAAERRREHLADHTSEGGL